QTVFRKGKPYQRKIRGPYQKLSNSKNLAGTKLFVPTPGSRISRLYLNPYLRKTEGGPKSYWAKMSASQRSGEMQRRMAVRKAKYAAHLRDVVDVVKAADRPKGGVA